MRYRRRLLLGLGLTGAAGYLVVSNLPPARGRPVPPDLVTAASALGVPNERFVIGTPEGLAAFQRELLESNARRQAALGVSPDTVPDERMLLAISGGGEDGAFGAGLICGWTEHGSRPEFHFVTGVSAGALIAPFAFVGPSRDAQLRGLYTRITTDQVVRARGWIGAVLGESLADNAPLLETIERHIDDGMLRDIADGYRAGRMLLVATVNLDAQSGVWWNLGAIAASGRPGALRLVQRVLLASAAIPGVFPPTMFDVTAEGAPYQEMHVDGGALAQTFLYPSSFATQRRERIRQGLPVPVAEAYVIRNARLHAGAPQPPVGRWSVSIAERAISALIRANGFGDIERIHTLALRDGIGFNLASIGEDFTATPQQSFDAGYMRALFSHGIEKGRAGYPWLKRPPF